MVLMQRFGMHRSEDEGLFEKTDEFLQRLLEQLGEKPVLIGSEFTAADLTMACLIRPLNLVPYFKDNPKYDKLFEHHNRWAKVYAVTPMAEYELAAKEARSMAANPSLSAQIWNGVTYPLNLTFQLFSNVLVGTVRMVFPRRKQGVQKTTEDDKPGVAKNDQLDVTILKPKALINGEFISALYNYIFELPRQQKMHIKAKL